MKNFMKWTATALLLAGLAACAATETSRSTGEVIDDTTIATQVKAKLLADPVTDGLDIDVEVDRSRVQLNGFVDSADQLEQATKLARSVNGVESVDNNLRVTEGQRMAGEYVDDKILVGRVNSRLAGDKLTSALAIDVEANRGVVSLGGHVDSERERTAAADAASKVPGVVRVINNLKVR